MKIFRSLIIISISVTVLACASLHVKNGHDSSTNKAAHEVAGTISLIFSPTVLAQPPKPPIDVSLILKAKTNGEITVYRIIDPNPVWHLTARRDGVAIKNFRFTFQPKEYQMQGLKINSKSLGARMFRVPLGEPYFTVAEDNVCTYVGRINFAFVRLPRGSLDQARKVVHWMANHFNRPFGMVYLPLGALVPVGFSVDKPKERESSTEMRSSYRLYKKKLPANAKSI